jgi:hypothetical protein
MHADWIPSLSGPEQLAEPAMFTGILMPLADLMCAIQLFLVQHAFEFFHPDDLQCLARRIGPDGELILKLQAAFVPAPHAGNGRTELDLEISAVIGPAAEFEDFIEKFRAHMEC